jgi:hypothetical protein
VRNVTFQTIGLLGELAAVGAFELREVVAVQAKLGKWGE